MIWAATYVTSLPRLLTAVAQPAIPVSPLGQVRSELLLYRRTGASRPRILSSTQVSRSVWGVACAVCVLP